MKKNNNNVNQKYKNFQKNIQYTLTLTNEAQKKIKKIMLDDINILGLRIDIKKSGCAGFSYVFKKVFTQKKINNTDMIFQYDNGAKLFIAYETMFFINGSELDYIKDDLNYTFKFKNPNVRHLCGCGASFNI